MPSTERILEAVHALGVFMTERGRGDEPIELSSPAARITIRQLGFPDVAAVLA